MSTENNLPDLLPWDVAPAVVLTPERILQHQADLLTKKSSGRLNGEVQHTESDQTVTLSFVVAAPALEYSVRLLSCDHEVGLPYPTYVSSGNSTYQHKVDSEDEFRKQVKEILGAPYARSIFQSLIARIGEVEQSNKFI